MSTFIIADILRPSKALNWQNLRVVSALVFVFLAGASAGALTMSLGIHETLHRKIDSREPGRESVLRSFKTNLGLTAEQSNEIAMVLEDYRRYYESLRDQLDDLQSTGKNRILQVLNPTQRDKFEKLMMDLAPQLASGGKLDH